MISLSDCERFALTPVFLNKETSEAIRKSFKQMRKNRLDDETRTCRKCHQKFNMFEMVRKEMQFPKKDHVFWFCEQCHKLLNRGWLTRA